VLTCAKQGRQSVVPKKRPGQTIGRVRNAKISRPLSAQGQMKHTAAARAHFHHPLRAAAHDRLSVRCGPNTTKPWGGTVPPPAGRPRAQVKERAGRITLFSSSAMSSGRLFLDQVARQQSPSPLYRQPQHNTHSSEPRAKGDISTLPGRGHFYFALTGQFYGLTRKRVHDKVTLPAKSCIFSPRAAIRLRSRQEGTQWINPGRAGDFCSQESTL
jgi:hypothetical protein